MVPCIRKQAKLRETKRCRYTGQQPGTKSASRPTDKPLVNRGSTAGFVPSVYSGFSLLLAKGRSGQLSMTPWEPKGTVGLWATRPVGIQFCQALLRPAATPCAAPTRTARGMCGFWTQQIYSCTSAYVCVCIRIQKLSVMCLNI